MEYLNKMKEIQNHILEFLDSETEDQPNFDNLSQIIKSQTSHLEVQELKSFLNIILKIVENHHRSPFFFEKINSMNIKHIYYKKQSNRKTSFCFNKKFLFVFPLSNRKDCIIFLFI